jgi:hypothetical protein
MFLIVIKVLLFLCMFRSVSLCCSVYCLCVNVYWTADTGISGHFAATLLRFFRAFSSVVRQMPGYNSQFFPCNCNLFPCKYYMCSVLCILCTVCVKMCAVLLYSVYCLCENVCCTAATGCQPNCSKIIIIIIIVIPRHCLVICCGYRKAYLGI